MSFLLMAWMRLNALAAGDDPNAACIRALEAEIAAPTNTGDCHEDEKKQNPIRRWFEGFSPLHRHTQTTDPMDEPRILKLMLAPAPHDPIEVARQIDEVARLDAELAGDLAFLKRHRIDM